MQNTTLVNNINYNNTNNNTNITTEKVMRVNDPASANLQYAVIQKAAASKAYL